MLDTCYNLYQQNTYFIQSVLSYYLWVRVSQHVHLHLTFHYFPSACFNLSIHVHVFHLSTHLPLSLTVTLFYILQYFRLFYLIIFLLLCLFASSVLLMIKFEAQKRSACLATQANYNYGNRFGNGIIITFII